MKNPIVAAKYAASPKGRAAKEKYEASPKGIAAKKRYDESTKGRAARTKVIESVRGRKNRMVQGAKTRAKERGLPFNLVPEDFELPDDCPVLGFSLSLKSGGGKRYNTPSLDRINPPLGYVKGNVRVISWRANQLRSNATLAELKALVADAERLDRLSPYYDIR